MAKAPVGQMSKQELVELYRGRCKHGHRYLEHYDCYLREAKNPAKVGFLDIETFGLRADFGVLLTYSIKVGGEDTILSSTVTKAEFDKSLDLEITKRAVEDLRKFDQVITYYGTKFDIPFLRTRAVHHQLKNFPVFGEMQHRDAYYIIKPKFLLTRSRLEVAARLLLGKTEKNHVDFEIWVQALRGSSQALDYILDHNKRDVRDLEKLYNLVMVYSKNNKRSI